MLIGLAFAWFGGYFIAGLALAPVERIRRGAEAINAQGLSRRLGPPYPRDELGALTRSLDGMIDRLDQAFQRERQFTSDASHELRTPLSILRTEIEVALSQERSTSEYQQLLAVLLDETTRLGKLVEDMLTLARIDAGYRLEFTPTALHDLLLTAADRLLPLIEQRGVTLRIDRLDSVVVLGDPGWLTQVFLALVQNAAQHTHRGGLIRLELRGEGANAVLSVADTGEGIAPEHLPRIFDRFYRVNSARSRVDGGAGLGLAICSWAVQAHGGTIRVESELGRGATFLVTLPAQIPADLMTVPSRFARVRQEATAG
jgi:heavy metal sensor kinase